MTNNVIVYIELNEARTKFRVVEMLDAMYNEVIEDEQLLRESIDIIKHHLKVETQNAI